jgi:hypothetical protein
MGKGPAAGGTDPKDIGADSEGSEEPPRVRSSSDLVGGEVPEALLAQMMADLSAGSDPAVPLRLRGLMRRWGRTGLAVIGGFVVVTALLLLLGVGGLCL